LLCQQYGKYPCRFSSLVRPCISLSNSSELHFCLLSNSCSRNHPLPPEPVGFLAGLLKFVLYRVFHLRSGVFGLMAPGAELNGVAKTVESSSSFVACNTSVLLSANFRGSITFRYLLSFFFSLPTICFFFFFCFFLGFNHVPHSEWEVESEIFPQCLLATGGEHRVGTGGICFFRATYCLQLSACPATPRSDNFFPWKRHHSMCSG